jgi:hypothetical protein
VSGGNALLRTAGLAAGTHHLAAVYGGDGNFACSTSASFDLTINPARTAVSLSVPNSSTAGDQVTLAAMVTDTDSPATPAGHVAFYDGTTQVGVAPLSGALTASGISPTLAGIVRSIEQAIVAAPVLPKVLAEWRQPRHDYGTGDRPTTWKLLNCFTTILGPRSVPARRARRLGVAVLELHDFRPGSPDTPAGVPQSGPSFGRMTR